MTEPTCAVWYYHYYSIIFELCDDEYEAARTALSMSENGWGSPVGVQFSDGSFVHCGEWARLRELELEMEAASLARYEAEKSLPPPETRTVLTPFPDDSSGWSKGPREVKIEADAPDWVGVKP